jgi:aspartyl-tRNA(Asn)/glutamyl-tRNA(Gln) amidotransferase subunit C
MAPQLTRDEVAHIAGLARLDLPATELDTLARQLTDILAYAAIVQQADANLEPANLEPGTPNLEPANPGTPEARNPGTLRIDSPAPSLDRDDVLAQAPDAVPAAGLFRVPKVL